MTTVKIDYRYKWGCLISQRGVVHLFFLNAHFGTKANSGNFLLNRKHSMRTC